jgi:hypothetical protein
MVKLQATALRMMPIPKAVSLPFFEKMFAADGSFSPDEAPAEGRRRGADRAEALD